MRQTESEGRAGKQPDGTAKTREAKLVLVWTAETRNPQGRPVRDPGSVSYSGAIESAASRDTDPDPSAFARRVRREAERRGFPDAARRVVLGDGAAWIWNLSSEQFLGAIQIVDLWHAKEHLWEVSKALHAGDAGRVEAWARARCHELEAGRLDYLLQVLRSRAGHCEPAQRCADYVERNQRLVRVLELVRVEEWLPYSRGWRGRPLKDRAALARAFLAKAVLDVPTTRALVERLRTEGLLRRLCGWEAAGGVPSEATFSRAFAKFAASDLPGACMRHCSTER